MLSEASIASAFLSPSNNYRVMRIRLLLLNLLLIPAVQAQGVMQPLTIQGIQQQDPVAVRARAMGGAFAASGGGSPEAMLLNPAGLTSISRPCPFCRRGMAVP